MSGLLRSRHQLQSRLLQRKLARAVRKSIKHGLRIDADIVRRREHTGMPGHSPHPTRRRVMHGAPKQVTKIGILARIAVALVVNCCWCDARQKTGAPCAWRTGDQHAPFWRGSPGDRSSSRLVWTACFGWRKVMGVFHAKRRKDIPLNVNVFCLAGEFLDQRAKQNVVDVRVAENLTGTRLQRRGERTMNAFGFSGSVQSPRILEVDVYPF